MLRRIALLGCVLLAACGGGDSVAPTRVLTALTVILTPSSLQVGQTSTATATAVDQNGAGMPPGTVLWSSGSSAATIAADGKITAVQTGQATITGVAGGKTAQAVITVAPMPATALSFTTAPQTTWGNRYYIRPEPVVQLVNALGQPTAQAGVLVSTSVSLGTVAGTTSATTDANGRATFANLAFTGVIGRRNLVFSAPGTSTLTAPVNLIAGPVAFGNRVAGDAQLAKTGTAVATAPSVRLFDSDGNVTPTVPTEFVIVLGGGSVTGSPTTTDADGVATVGSWNLGPTVGANSLQVRPVGYADGIIFTATATAAIMQAVSSPFDISLYQFRQPSTGYWDNAPFDQIVVRPESAKQLR